MESTRVLSHFFAIISYLCIPYFIVSYLSLCLHLFFCSQVFLFCVYALLAGIVTEDSDVFLFGGECIYKNMFSDRRDVEVYLAQDVKRELGVSRSEFVCLSYLLGSDYSEGVKGVGIVNAMEILATFGQQQKEGGGKGDEEEGIVEPKREEEEGGGFMSKDSYASSALVKGRTVAGAESENGLLEEVQRTLEEFKEWLFTGHDFMQTLEKLRGGGGEATSPAGGEVEPVVSERVRRLVSGDSKKIFFTNILHDCVEYY